MRFFRVVLVNEILIKWVNGLSIDSKKFMLQIMFKFVEVNFWVFY
jgi:hypothetical protein